MIGYLGRTIATVALILFILFAGLLLLAYRFSEGHGASLARLAQVRPGMGSERVVALLGRPGMVHRSADWSESWYYSRRTFCQIKVYFSPQRLVTETDHDH